MLLGRSKIFVYIGRRFLTSLLMTISILTSIIFMIDLIELLRNHGSREEFTATIGFLVALMDLPHLTELILPFMFLFGAMLSLIALTQKLELVVVRSAGVSVWGFLAPPLVVAFCIGLASTFILNPVASSLRERANQIEAEVLGRTIDEGFRSGWFRQESNEGSSIVYAGRIEDDGRVLRGVTAFVFDGSDSFEEKIDARVARYDDGAWAMTDVTVSPTGERPRSVETYSLATGLSADELDIGLSPPESLSVWSLGAFIDTAERTGINTNRYKLEFHSLLARPFFLAAMVTIAALFSLNFHRSGGIAMMIVAGIGLSFLLYIVTGLLSDLGANGIISPIAAAWAPSILALTFGATALLYMEDG